MRRVGSVDRGAGIDAIPPREHLLPLLPRVFLCQPDATPNNRTRNHYIVTNQASSPAKRPVFDRALDVIEGLGNKLPDPAVLFLLALALTWIGSWLLAGTQVEVPKAGDGKDGLEVQSRLSGEPRRSPG